MPVQRSERTRPYEGSVSGLPETGDWLFSMREYFKEVV